MISGPSSLKRLRDQHAADCVEQRDADVRTIGMVTRPKCAKRIDHALVHRALERDHQIGKVAHRLPAPLDEFRLMAAGRRPDVDFVLVAGEAQRVPFLRLPAILALPGLLRDSCGRS